MRHEPVEARSYSVCERDEIVRLAARLQASYDEACALPEIEAAAFQVGIHPRFVREAATTLSPSQRLRTSRPTTLITARSWDVAAILLLPTLFFLRFWHHAPVSPAYEGLPLLAGWHAYRFGRAGAGVWVATLLFLLGGVVATLFAGTDEAWSFPPGMYLFARPLPLVVLGPLLATFGWGLSRCAFKLCATPISRQAIASRLN